VRNAALVILAALILLAAAQARAANPVPGSACATGTSAGDYVLTGGSNSGSIYNLMVCNGSTYAGIINFQSTGNVGIGTTSPASALHVNGGITVGNDTASCTSANSGELKYLSTASPAFTWCNGSAWVPFEYVPYYSVQTAASISVGPETTCSLKSTGALWCWGYNIYGQLGNGNTISQKVPVAASSAFAGPWASISNSISSTCGIATSGSGYCWGLNSTGQLGNGTTTNSTTVPVQISGTWVQLATGGSAAEPSYTNAPAVAYVTCGVKSDNSGWCWGGNANGELGNGTTTESNSPVQVTGSWRGIWPSGYGFHTCGLTTVGALWCWGYGQYGQLGQGNTSDSASPVQIAGTWSSVSVGGLQTCAINTSNALYCWGLNTSGQLGDGTVTNRTSPVQISGAWAKISTGGPTAASTCGIKTDGTVWCWGSNVYGQLGINSSISTNITSPTALTAFATVSGTGWSDIQTTNIHICGLRNDGTVYCWGANAYGDIGDPNYGGYATPVGGS
jgi:alpha-tubulin suppressor-like RCC1 family protein